jgi:hypothetical protein
MYREDLFPQKHPYVTDRRAVLHSATGKPAPASTRIKFLAGVDQEAGINSIQHVRIFVQCLYNTMHRRLRSVQRCRWKNLQPTSKIRDRPWAQPMKIANGSSASSISEVTLIRRGTSIQKDGYEITTDGFACLALSVFLN